jgi:TrmH family RNA methyltransferase
MKLEDVRKLQQKKYREQFGCFVLEGEHLVLELQKAALHDARLRDSAIYVTHEHAHWPSQLATHVISARQMAQISETRAPQGILAVAPLLASPAPRAGERAIYLHEIQDPGNLGTILRTLAWFGSFRCLLSPGSVDVHNGKTVRASMGAILRVPVEHDIPLDALRDRFGRIACLDVQGEPITSPAFRDFECYVYGNEARGLPRHLPSGLQARAFTVNGTGRVESLNVATSLALCQYELHRPV